MDHVQPQVTVGSVKLYAGPPGQVMIEHTGRGGVVQIPVDSVRLERWCLRLLRDEAFKPVERATA